MTIGAAEHPHADLLIALFQQKITPKLVKLKALIIPRLARQANTGQRSDVEWIKKQFFRGEFQRGFQRV
ncbi:hypothetical protein D3C71_1858520 [compost metagenome]